MLLSFMWMIQDLTDDKSALVPGMAWCRQAASHYLNQCWSRSMSTYVVRRLQLVKNQTRTFIGFVVDYSGPYAYATCSTTNTHSAVYKFKHVFQQFYGEINYFECVFGEQMLFGKTYEITQNPAADGCVLTWKEKQGTCWLLAIYVVNLCCECYLPCFNAFFLKIQLKMWTRSLIKKILQCSVYVNG